MPSQIGGITSLEALFLDTNKLSGSIPDSFGNLQHLKQLYLFQNNLTGTVPTSLKNLNHLSKQFFSSMPFTQILFWLADTLRHSISYHLLFDSIHLFCVFVVAPFEFLIDQYTAGIGLESNSIIGEVPDEVCGMVHHQHIDMWADCSSANGLPTLTCPCCDVCCPGEDCIVVAAAAAPAVDAVAAENTGSTPTDDYYYYYQQ